MKAVAYRAALPIAAPESLIDIALPDPVATVKWWTARSVFISADASRSSPGRDFLEQTIGLAALCTDPAVSARLVPLI